MSAGGGKSTLCNVLCGSDVFKESAGSVSCTSVLQQSSFTVADTIFTVIDTVGVGDTSLSEREVLRLLGAACSVARSGLHAILFVCGGRMTAVEARAWQLLFSVVLLPAAQRITTLVCTHFNAFMNADECAKDVADMTASASDDVKAILRSCRQVLHAAHLGPEVDPEQKSRFDNRTRLLALLGGHADVYVPLELDSLPQRIAAHRTAAEKLEDARLALIRAQEEEQRLKDQLANGAAGGGRGHHHHHHGGGHHHGGHHHHRHH